VRATLLAKSSRFVDRVLVEANVRDRHLMDVWRIDLKTGAAELDTVNPGDVTTWLVDAALVVRGAVASTREGTDVRFRDSAKAPWRSLISGGAEETVDALGFTDDGKALWVTTSIDADTGRLVEKSLKTGAEREVASSPVSDVLAVLGHPTKQLVRAVAFGVAGRRTWTAVDFGVKGDLESLAKALAGDFSIESMDAADARWVVAETRDVGPVRFFLWDRKAKRLEPLFSSRPRLEGLALSPMTPVVVPARDGLRLSGYLTRPLGSTQAGPLVLEVHAGPASRDEWGYQGETQLWANRGYSVLQVNFRGSTGFGKRLFNAGNREWGRAMQADLLDAVQWAVREGIADPRRVAIVGRGYGGYAALAGLVFTPDVFACGVDLAGPSNLFTHLAATAAMPVSLEGQLLRRLGDPNEPSDKERLTQASPLFFVEQLKAPLLIEHGANDPWVRPTESEQLVAALEKGPAKVTYVLYPDEGRRFERAENRLDFYGRMEAFLAQCLNGRAEPLPSAGRVPGSTAVEHALRSR
jgi:dipeptidyl aminopeptidase/acylaminoacyl peptidase